MYPSHTGSRLSRRLFVRASLAATATAAAGAVLAACGETAIPTPTAPVAATAPTATAARPTVAPTAAPTTAPVTAPTAVATVTATLTSSTASTPTASRIGGAGGTVAPIPAGSPTATDGKIPGTTEGVSDAYTKLPAPFKATANIPGGGGKVSAFMIAFNPPVPPRGQNRYWQELEKRLGVQYDVTFATAASYQEKLAAVTASGDLPDFTQLMLSRAPDQYRPLLQGVYTDLGPYLTGDARKEYPNLAALPEKVWQATTINRKLYGVPRTGYFVNVPLFFRRDWAEKVGVPQAKNADEFLQTMVAFAKADPDGNGRQDTFGATGLANNPYSLNWFYHMFRVPNQWRLNPDGTLTNQIETEEFRATIAYARKMVEMGAYHPEAATMSLQQARDAFVGSKVGSYASGWGEYAGMAGIPAKLRAASAPNANVVALIPPGHDGGKPAWRTNSPVTTFAAINARVGRDRERTRELLRILDWWAAPFGSEEYLFLNYGLEGVHHTVRPNGDRVLTDLGRTEIGELPLLMNGIPAFYFSDTPDAAPYLQGVMREMAATAVDDPVVNFYSPTGAQRAGELNQLQTDRLTAVIAGREPFTALDTYVRDWRSRGGDTIRREYQDALKA